MFFSQKKCVEFLQKQFAKIYFPTFKVVVGGAEWQRARETQPKNFNQRISTKDYPSKNTNTKEYQPKTTVGGGRKRQGARATQPKNINYRHWPAGKHCPGWASRHICTGRLKVFYIGKKLQQKMSVKGVSQSCRCITGVWQKKLSASDWEKQGAVRACVIVVVIVIVIVGANGEKTNIRTSWSHLGSVQENLAFSSRIGSNCCVTSASNWNCCTACQNGKSQLDIVLTLALDIVCWNGWCWHLSSFGTPIKGCLNLSKWTFFSEVSWTKNQRQTIAQWEHFRV